MVYAFFCELYCAGLLSKLFPPNRDRNLTKTEPTNPYMQISLEERLADTSITGHSKVSLTLKTFVTFKSLPFNAFTMKSSLQLLNRTIENCVTWTFEHSLSSCQRWLGIRTDNEWKSIFFWTEKGEQKTLPTNHYVVEQNSNQLEDSTI